MCTLFEFKTLKDLEELFKRAKKDKAIFIATIVKTEGYESSEMIINTDVNFDKKLEYYKNAYNDDLTLKSCNKIKILGGVCADSLLEIEENLFD